MTEISRNTLRERPNRRQLYDQAFSSPQKKQNTPISLQKNTNPKAKSYPSKKESKSLSKTNNSQAKLLARLINTVNRYYYQSKKREECKWQELERRVQRQTKNQASTKKKSTQTLAKRSQDKKAEAKDTTQSSTSKSSQKSPSISKSSSKNKSPSQQLKSFGLYQSKDRIRRCNYHIIIALNIFLTKQISKANGKDTCYLDPTFPARLLKANSVSQHLQCHY